MFLNLKEQLVGPPSSTVVWNWTSLISSRVVTRSFVRQPLNGLWPLVRRLGLSRLDTAFPCLNLLGKTTCQPWTYLMPHAATLASREMMGLIPWVLSLPKERCIGLIETIEDIGAPFVSRRIFTFGRIGRLINGETGISPSRTSRLSSFARSG